MGGPAAGLGAGREAAGDQRTGATAGASSAARDDASPDPDELHLTTVGVDVGSSTSHLMLADLTLRRMATRHSSCYVVTEREVRWRSPVVLTPFLPDGRIDAAALGQLVRATYRDAAIEPEAVDSGAVLLTGTALLRCNARAIAEQLAAVTGNLVCASAGHHLEGVLAAHGSGAVARSRRIDVPLLHLDIGGGTTKLVLLDRGEVVATAAMAVGGRLLAYDDERTVVRMEEVLGPVAARHAPSVAIGRPLDPSDEQALADVLAGAVAAAVRGDWEQEQVRRLLLTDPIERLPSDAALSFSGGVAAYLDGPAEPVGDLGRALATALRASLGGHRRELLGEAPAIRATVIGASQFSVRVSGNTVSVDEAVLPLRNLAAVTVVVGAGAEIEAQAVASRVVSGLRRLEAGIGREGETGAERPAAALAVGWTGDPSYPRLRALAEGLATGWRAAGRGETPLAVVVDADIARSLGRVLDAVDPGLASVSVVDGVEVRELDYVDVGTVTRPAGVVPVVVRSLVFPDGGDG